MALAVRLHTEMRPTENVNGDASDLDQTKGFTNEADAYHDARWSVQSITAKRS